MAYESSIERVFDDAIQKALKLAPKITSEDWKKILTDTKNPQKPSIQDIWLGDDLGDYDPNTTIPVRKYLGGTIPPYDLY